MAEKSARTLAQRRDRKRKKKRAQATDIEWWLTECPPKKRLARKKKKKKPQKPRDSWLQERATSDDHPIETPQVFADQDDSRRIETRQGRGSSPTPEFLEAVVIPSDGPSSTGSRQEEDVDRSPSEELLVIVHQSSVDNGCGHHELTTWQVQQTSGRSRRQAMVTQGFTQMICPVVVPCPFTGVHYLSYQTVRAQMTHAQF